MTFHKIKLSSHESYTPVFFQLLRLNKLQNIRPLLFFCWCPKHSADLKLSIPEQMLTMHGEEQSLK